VTLSPGAGGDVVTSECATVLAVEVVHGVAGVGDLPVQELQAA